MTAGVFLEKLGRKHLSSETTTKWNNGGLSWATVGDAGPTLNFVKHCFNASSSLGTPEIGLQQTIPVPLWLENPIDLRGTNGRSMSADRLLHLANIEPIYEEYAA